MQQIIVYRNPLEAAVWNALAGDGLMIFLCVIFMGIFWAVMCGVSQWALRRWTNVGYYNAGSHAMTIASVLILILSAFLYWKA